MYITGIPEKIKIKKFMGVVKSIYQVLITEMEEMNYFKEIIYLILLCYLTVYYLF